MIIRNFNETDIQQAVNLLNDCRPYVFAHNEYLYWMLAEYYNSTSFVCYDSGSVIGFVSGLLSADKSTVFVWQLCIHPNYRRKGIANRLLKSVLDVVVANNIQSIQLSMAQENAASYKLFEGFSGENSLTMEHVRTVAISGAAEVVYQIKV